MGEKEQLQEKEMVGGWAEVSVWEKPEGAAENEVGMVYVEVAKMLSNHQRRMKEKMEKDEKRNGLFSMMVNYHGRTFQC